MPRIRLKLNKRFQRYFAEMFLIILSVLLAFLLNEMRNNHIEKKKLITSLEFIREEIIQNRSYTIENLHIHETIIEKIDSLLTNEKYNLIYSPKNGFVYHRIYNKSYFDKFLSSDAWTIANNNNILDNLNIGEVVDISRAYEQQEMVTKVAVEIGDFFNSDAVFDKNRTKVNCQILKNKFNTLYGLELRLNYNYDKALKTLSRITKN